MTDLIKVVTDNHTVLSVIKLVILFVILGHTVVILIIEKQIHSADRVGSPFAHKLIELTGYINMITLALIFLILLLPI